MSTPSNLEIPKADSGGWRNLFENRGVPEAILVALTLLIYARSLGCGFVYDDHSMVEHPMPFTWQNFVAAFSNDFSLDHASNFYRPLTVLFQAFVASIAGTDAIAWHLVGILLHVVCVVLVFHLACRLLHDRLLATFAAAVFASHPTHVEAVTWVSDSADPLLTIFLLLASLALIHWTESGKLVWGVAAWMCCTTCCFIKETGVLAPLMLGIVVACLEVRTSKPAMLITGLSFVGSSIGFLALRGQVLHGFSHPLSNAGTAEMLLTWPTAIWFYFSHLVFPTRLALFYPVAFVTEWRTVNFLLPLLFATALVAISIAMFRHTRDRRILSFCLAWGFIPLLAPLYLKLFPAFELVHDRYLYIPSIALGVGLAKLLAIRRSDSPEHGNESWKLAVMAVVLVAASAQTVIYQRVWKSDMSLFEHAVEVTPLNDRAIVNLGVNKLQAGETEQGTALLKRALSIQPKNAMALFNLGNAAWKNGDPVAAEAYIQRALSMEAHPKWLVLLANVEMKLGKPQNTEILAGQAIELNPAEPGAHLMFGAARLQQGDAQTAVREFGAELDLYPQNPAALQALQFAREQSRQHR